MELGGFTSTADDFHFRTFADGLDEYGSRAVLWACSCCIGGRKTTKTTDLEEVALRNFQTKLFFANIDYRF